MKSDHTPKWLVKLGVKIESLWKKVVEDNNEAFISMAQAADPHSTDTIYSYMKLYSGDAKGSLKALIVMIHRI